MQSNLLALLLSLVIFAVLGASFHEEAVDLAAKLDP
jgi:hypothetical protein